MDRWKALRQWIDERRDWCFDLMRVYLGVGLFVKGLAFVQDREVLAISLREAGTSGFRFDFLATFLAHYIPAAHLVGGLMLVLGLLTRVAALIQLPVLLGAVLFVYGPNGLFTYNQNFQFTALVLFLLVLIVIHGGGELSGDRLINGKKGTG